MTAGRTQRRPAFTLIEILIVVVILGILAGIVLPQFSNATTVARENTLREDLRYLRTQITAFKYQHIDTPPGFPGGDRTGAPDETTFISQMTHFTDPQCNVSTSVNSDYPCGPYLARMPANPINGSNRILVTGGSDMPAADDSQPFGWIYNPDLEKFSANLAGVDTAGKSYSSY